jgi:hypothetical protein
MLAEVITVKIINNVHTKLHCSTNEFQVQALPFWLISEQHNRVWRQPGTMETGSYRMWQM